MTGDGDPQRYTDSYVTSVIEDHANAAARDFAASGDPFVLYAWHLAPHYRITPEGGRSLPLAAPQDEDQFLDARPSSFDDPAFDEQLEGRCEIAYLPRTPEIGSFDRTRPCGEGQEGARETLVR